MKKFIKRFIAVICIAASMSTCVYAKEPSAEVKLAYEYDWLYDSLLNKHDKEITRKEFAEVIMAFYRSVTGRQGITLNINRFFDTRSVDVAAACEIGFMSPIKETEFGTSGNITRKDAAVALYKLFNVCGLRIRPYSTKNSYFGDISKYKEDERLVINTLRANDIMVGNDHKFHGDSNMLVYELAAALVRAYEISQEVGVEIGGKVIYFDQSFETLVEDFGEPERKGKDFYGYDRYVYNSGDAASFFIVGVENGKVKEIFTNSSGFKYGDIISGMDYSEFDFSGYTNASTYSATKNNKFYSQNVGFASTENGIVIDSIRIYERKQTIYNSNFNSFFAETVEKEIMDIINVARTKNGFLAYSADENLKASLKKFNAEVSKSFKDGKGIDLSSFDRIEKDKIYYTAILEKKFWIKGGSAEVYEEILKDVASRAVINSKSLKNAAASATIIDKKLYLIIDLYK